MRVKIINSSTIELNDKIDKLCQTQFLFLNKVFEIYLRLKCFVLIELLADSGLGLQQWRCHWGEKKENKGSLECSQTTDWLNKNNENICMGIVFYRLMQYRDFLTQGVPVLSKRFYLISRRFRWRRSDGRFFFTRLLGGIRGARNDTHLENYVSIQGRLSA